MWESQHRQIEYVRLFNRFLMFELQRKLAHFIGSHKWHFGLIEPQLTQRNQKLDFLVIFVRRATKLQSTYHTISWKVLLTWNVLNIIGNVVTSIYFFGKVLNFCLLRFFSSEFKQSCSHDIRANRFDNTHFIWIVQQNRRLVQLLYSLKVSTSCKTCEINSLCFGNSRVHSSVSSSRVLSTQSPTHQTWTNKKQKWKQKYTNT